MPMMQTAAVSSALRVKQPASFKMYNGTGTRFNPNTQRSRLYQSDVVEIPDSVLVESYDVPETDSPEQSLTQKLLQRKAERDEAHKLVQSERRAHAATIERQREQKRLAIEAAKTDHRELAEQELQRLEKSEQRTKQKMDAKIAAEKKHAKKSGRYSDAGDAWSSNKCDKRYWKGFTKKYYGNNHFTRVDAIRALFPESEETDSNSKNTKKKPDGRVAVEQPLDSDEMEEERRMDAVHLQLCREAEEIQQAEKKKRANPPKKGSKSKRGERSHKHKTLPSALAGGTVVTSGTGSGAQFLVEFATVGVKGQGVGPKAFSCGKTRERYLLQQQSRQLQEKRQEDINEQRIKNANTSDGVAANPALSLQLRRLRWRLGGEIAEDVSSQTEMLQKRVEKTLDQALHQMLGHRTGNTSHDRLLPDKELKLEPRLWSASTNALSAEVLDRQNQISSRNQRQAQLRQFKAEISETEATW